MVWLNIKILIDSKHYETPSNTYFIKDCFLLLEATIKLIRLVKLTALASFLFERKEKRKLFHIFLLFILFLMNIFLRVGDFFFFLGIPFIIFSLKIIIIFPHPFGVIIFFTFFTLMSVGDQTSGTILWNKIFHHFFSDPLIFLFYQR